MGIEEYSADHKITMKFVLQYFMEEWDIKLKILSTLYLFYESLKLNQSINEDFFIMSTSIFQFNGVNLCIYCM